jgi:UDP-glucose 4-epimerase
MSTGSPDNIVHLLGHPQFEVTVGSVTDDALVARMVNDVDAVFHLAAAVGVKLVTSSPVHTIEANVNGTETVLRHASRRQIRVLVASTSEVYGKGVALPFREDADLVLGAPWKTRWGYAASKLLDEFIALAYWKERHTPAVVVRLFNTVGPRQSSRYGMVLPNFVRAALAGAPLTVHGDGSQTRCFTWVGDVVSAMSALIETPASAGEVFNIGNPEEISIRDLAHRVRNATGSSSSIQYAPYSDVFDASFEDMPRRVPDIAKISALVGYRPQVRLDDIIRRTVDFWSQDAPLAYASLHA